MSGPREGAAAGLGPPPGADVWHIRLDTGDGAALGLAAALLGAEERCRAGRLLDAAAAQRYVMAHGAARTILGAYLGVPGDAVHWAAGPHGKPEFGGAWHRWRWSLSRSGGHALLAVCLTAPVGVDLEQVDPRTQAVTLAARFLPPDEAAAVAALDTRQGPAGPRPATGPPGGGGPPAPYGSRAAQVAYHRLLSRKEACVKASGGRLLDGLRLSVLRPGTVQGTGSFTGRSWTLRDLPAPPGFVATLATEDDAAGRLRHFGWNGLPPPGGGGEGPP